LKSSETMLIFDIHIDNHRAKREPHLACLLFRNARIDFILSTKIIFMPGRGGRTGNKPCVEGRGKLATII